MIINYISNLPVEEISGGFSAMNATAHEALAEIAEVHYVGPVNPPVNRVDWLVSRAKRTAGIPGKFFFFSEDRLRIIAEEVDRLCRTDAHCDFYHGFTPWTRCVLSRPYLAWSDCCFRDYIDIYHACSTFEESDVQRICSGEKAWMRKAKSILLSSEWARLRTQTHYGLKESLLGDVSIFGAVEVPACDCYTGGRDFLFISTDYQRKNGPLCRRAMGAVWEKYPDARLNIIGAPPPAGDLVDSRVSYLGYLKKSVPEQLALFTHHLSRAFGLLHPTGADTTAMVVIEAGFYGCPSITVNSFALPEVTGQGAYALLLNSPPTVDSVAKAMIELLEDPKRYASLRAKARDFCISKFSRPAFKKRLQNAVLSSIAHQQCQLA
jgi:glycosyltransferase involved in cell wall biosynthesis